MLSGRQIRISLPITCLIVFAIVAYNYQLDTNTNKSSPRLTRQTIKRNGQSLSPLRKLQIVKMFEERRLHLQNACESFRKGHNLLPEDVALSKHHIVLIPEDKLSFCASKKSGSTFLRTIATSLTSFQMTTDPFKSDVQKMWRNPFGKADSFQKIHSKLSNITNVLFVRDPYSRYICFFNTFPLTTRVKMIS